MRRALFLPLLALSACTTQTAANDPTVSPDADTLRFAGTVQAIDDGCFADAVCSVTVDGTTVVTMVGWSRDVWGQRAPDLAIGHAVEVYCRRTAEGCTLNGDAGYYVRRKG